MRYDNKKKAEVVAFVKKHNAKNGRGGQSAAHKKYGISAITIAKWLTDAGETLPGKGGAKKAAKGKPKAKAKSKRKGKAGRPKGKGRAKAKKPAKKAAKRGRPKGSGKKSGAGRRASASSLGARIQRLAEIDKQIQSLQQEFDALKKSL